MRMDEVELFFFHPRQILSEEMRPVIKEIVFKTVFQPFSNMNCKKSLRNLKKNNFRTLTFQIYLFLCLTIL